MLMPTITPTTYTRCVVYYGACISELAINSPKKSLTRCGGQALRRSSESELFLLRICDAFSASQRASEHLVMALGLNLPVGGDCAGRTDSNYGQPIHQPDCHFGSCFIHQDHVRFPVAIHIPHLLNFQRRGNPTQDAG
jgi:hypothetical protein